MTPKRWDIVEVDFGTPVGHEQGKRRPAVVVSEATVSCLVVSNDPFNEKTELVTVCPISSTQRTLYPSEVEIPKMPGILEQPGIVMCQQILTVSTQRVIKVRGPAKDPVLQRKVEQALRLHLRLRGPDP